MRNVVAATTALFLFAALPVLASKAPPISTPSAPDPPSYCDSVSGNLVANCGFETGDFTGWTPGGNFAPNTVVTGPFDGYNPNSGSFFAALGPVGADGTLSQTLTTTPGQAYTLTFFFASNGTTPNDFTATFNGLTAFACTDCPVTGASAPFPFIEPTFTTVATSSSTTLEFAFRDDPAFLALDDIVVTPAPAAVPEPTSVVLLLSLVGLAGFGLRRHLSHRLTN